MKKFNRNRLPNLVLLSSIMSFSYIGLGIAVIGGLTGCSPDSNDTPPQSNEDLAESLQEQLQSNKFEANQLAESYALVQLSSWDDMHQEYPSYSWTKFLQSKQSNYHALLPLYDLQGEHKREYAMLANMVVFDLGLVQINHYIDEGTKNNITATESVYDTWEEDYVEDEVTRNLGRKQFLTAVTMPDETNKEALETYQKGLENTYNAVKELGYQGDLKSWTAIVNEQRTKINEQLNELKTPLEKEWTFLALSTWNNTLNHRYAKQQLLDEYQKSQSKEPLDKWIDHRANNTSSETNTSNSNFFTYWLLYSMLISGNTSQQSQYQALKADEKPNKRTYGYGNTSASSFMRRSINSNQSNFSRINNQPSVRAATSMRSVGSVSRGGFGGVSGRGGG